MPRICLVTALPAETRPLLDTMPFRQQGTRHLRLYTSDDYLLMETGLGKLNAAAATGALLQLYQDIPVVVNIGIAGGLFDIGKTLLAHRVQDQASNAQWFPHLPDVAAFRNTDSATLYTVDAPAADYREGVLFDMEAAGIFTAASRHLSTSQVHSIKVVSDNLENPLQRIDKHIVNQLMSNALADILPMLDALHAQFIIKAERMAGSTALQDVDALVQDVKLTTHHSVNDEQQLRRLLQQYLVLSGRLPELVTDKALSASALRHRLRAAITDIPLSYGDL